MDEVFMNMITAQSAKNTNYSNTTSHNFFKRGLAKLGMVRRLELIPPAELNTLISHCLKDAVKPDGKYDEPDVLSTYFRGLQRYLFKKFG